MHGDSFWLLESQSSSVVALSSSEISTIGCDMHRINDLSHPRLGQLTIFRVPLGPDKATRQNMQYQAVFN